MSLAMLTSALLYISLDLLVLGGVTFRFITKLRFSYPSTGGCTEQDELLRFSDVYTWLIIVTSRCMRLQFV